MPLLHGGFMQYGCLFSNPYREAMLRNYFKVAVRNILKYKFFSAINIFGMTVGITSCLLIILYVSHELSYDKFHRDAGRIYQVGLHGKIGGQDISVANTCPPMAAALV